MWYFYEGNHQICEQLRNTDETNFSYTPIIFSYNFCFSIYNILSNWLFNIIKVFKLNSLQILGFIFEAIKIKPNNDWSIAKPLNLSDYTIF